MGNKPTRGKLPPTAIIDPSDQEIVNSRTWRLTSNGYIAAKSKGKHIYLHRVLMDPPEGLYVDHKNGVRTDNRRSNLRIVTPSESRMNSAKWSSKTSSKYKGVYWNTAIKSWCVCITHKGRHIFHERCDTELEAAKLYNEVSKNIYGEFSRGNEI